MARVRIILPKTTEDARKVAANLMFRPIQSRPKTNRPKNVDSKKKAKTPSAARGAPKISPTNLDYSDQLVPNWNSIVIPVATPATKIMVNSLNQNRAILSYTSLPVRQYMPSMMVRIAARPMEIGGKKCCQTKLKSGKKQCIPFVHSFGIL